MDAGEVKAKVTVSYDDNGSFEKAKQDIGDTAKQLEELTKQSGDASDGMAQLEERAGKASEGVAQLAENASSLEEPFKAGQVAISEVTDTLGEHQTALEDVGKAYEQLSAPLESTVSLLEAAPAPMAMISQHAQTMSEQLTTAGTGFTQIQEALSESAPLLPQYAESLHRVGQAISSEDFGLSDFTENMAVFNDALQNPEPFSMIQSHLNETAQTWDDFASSIGEDNTHLLSNMAQIANNVGAGLGPIALTPDRLAAIGPETVWDQTASSIMGMGSAASDTASPFAALNETIVDTAKSAEAARPQMGGVSETVISAGKAAEDAVPQFGAWNEVMGDTGLVMEDMGKSSKSAWDSFSGWVTNGGPKGEGGLAGVGGFIGGIMDGLNSVAMPLMAVQMIAMVVQSVGQGIYDAAAIAEGPAAHGVGTFTGAIDTMAASTAKAGQSFSEAFGQQVLPNLDAINNVTGKSGGDFWGGVGGALGGVANMVMTNAELVLGGGLDLVGSGLTLGQQNNWGGTLWSEGTEGIQNTWASINGQPEPYPSPASNPQALIQQQVATAMAALPAQLAIQTATLNYQAQDPTFLAAQANYASAMQKATIAQTAYNDSHYVGTSTPAESNYVANEATNALYGAGTARMPTSGSDLALNAAYFNSLGDPYVGGGCFIAGTRVLMANGAEKPIEMLQIGEQVIAHDDTRQVSTVILALIVPPPRQVYELTFSDGNTLTLTDSHPIATPEGWKSLSPSATRKENPDLVVATLQIGDNIYTADGATCTLVAVQAREVVQVYNITVDDPHTFYANGVLVHNKARMESMESSQPDSSGAVSKTIPITVSWDISGELQKTWQASSVWNIAGDLAKSWQASSVWSLAGDLAKSWQASSVWSLAGDLAKSWNASSVWSLAGDLAKSWNASSIWSLAGDLQKDWQAVSIWSLAGDLNKMWQSSTSWNIVGDLNKAWQSAVTWKADNLDPVFNASPIWNATNLNPVFQVAATFLGVPGFASGVENFGGGVAVVGEKGPELVTLPSGASVYPMTTGPGVGSSVSLGGGGGGGPQSVNVSVQIDSQSLIQAMGIPMSQNIRVSNGMRGY